MKTYFLTKYEIDYTPHDYIVYLQWNYKYNLCFDNIKNMPLNCITKVKLYLGKHLLPEHLQCLNDINLYKSTLQISCCITPKEYIEKTLWHSLKNNNSHIRGYYFIDKDFTILSHVELNYKANSNVKYICW